jgi:6-phosphofructokinase 1
MAKVNAVVGQSGGGTSVINCSLSGLVDRLLHQSGSTFDGILYGSLHGSEGIKGWNVQPLNDIQTNEWREIRRTAAAWLGSTRDKPDEEYCARILENFKKNDVRIFFYIGGNDSADTANTINTIAIQEGYELRSYHIHKTVDNDLVRGHHMPGFPSAAKHLIYTAADLVSDGAALPGIVVIESMGRHSGYLTAAASLINEVLSGARVDPLVYVPEVPVDLNDMVDSAMEMYHKRGIALVVYSEGIKNKEGVEYKKILDKSTETDPRGQIRLSASPVLISEIQRMIKYKDKKMRVVPHMAGYPQRADPRTVSEVDKHEAYHLGCYAGKVALIGESDGNIPQDGSFGIEAEEDPYQPRFVRFGLEDVAQKSRELDKKYLLKNGQVNVAEYTKYLRHMLGSLNIKNALNPKLLKP